MYMSVCHIHAKVILLSVKESNSTVIVDKKVN